MYEGGIRGAAFLSSPLLGRSYTYTGLMHLVDWTPTLLHAAGRVLSLYKHNHGFRLYSNIHPQVCPSPPTWTASPCGTG